MGLGAAVADVSKPWLGRTEVWAQGDTRLHHSVCTRDASGCWPQRDVAGDATAAHGAAARAHPAPATHTPRAVTPHTTTSPRCCAHTPPCCAQAVLPVSRLCVCTATVHPTRASSKPSCVRYTANPQLPNPNLHEYGTPLTNSYPNPNLHEYVTQLTHSHPDPNLHVYGTQLVLAS